MLCPIQTDAGISPCKAWHTRSQAIAVLVLGRTSPFTSSERKDAVRCKHDFIAVSTAVWAPAFSKRCLHWTWEVSHQLGQTAHTTSFTTRPLFVLVSIQQGAEMPCPVAVFLSRQVQVKLSLPLLDPRERAWGGGGGCRAESTRSCLPSTVCQCGKESHK